jgi:hypothetical protein
MFQLCFNLNIIHDSVGKALRTAKQDLVTAGSHALSFEPGLEGLIFPQCHYRRKQEYLDMR